MDEETREYFDRILSTIKTIPLNSLERKVDIYYAEYIAKSQIILNRLRELIVGSHALTERINELAERTRKG